jgi:hypothetical protein
MPKTIWNLKSVVSPLGAIVLMSLMSGCASITGTSHQRITVQTLGQEGREVRDAACELTNTKGKWLVDSPGSVTVIASNDDMQVLCGKQGLEPGKASVVSRIKGEMFGNIFIGGGIGAIVDHGTGAGYEYPPFIQVQMAAFKKIELPYPYAEQPAAKQLESLQPAVSQPEPSIFLSPRTYVIPNPLYR